MPIRVVIADDDQVTAEILARTLRQWNYDPVVASDGARRLGRAAASIPRRRWRFSTG